MPAGSARGTGRAFYKPEDGACRLATLRGREDYSAGSVWGALVRRFGSDREPLAMGGGGSIMHVDLIGLAPGGASDRTGGPVLPASWLDGGSSMILETLDQCGGPEPQHGRSIGDGVGQWGRLVPWVLRWNLTGCLPDPFLPFSLGWYN